MTLARRFGEIVRERGITRGAEPITTCSTFEQWLGEARTCGVRAVETFAQGLEQDGDAVRAALTTPWSNAQSEGQITKLKLTQAPDVRPRQLRLAAPSNAARGMSASIT